MLPIKQRSKIGGNLQKYKKSALSAVDSLADDIQQIVNTTWSIEVDCAALCRVICLSDLLYSRCFGVLHGKFQCSSLSHRLTDSLTHSLTLSLCFSCACLPVCVRCPRMWPTHRMSNAPQFILLGLSMFTMV